MPIHKIKLIDRQLVANQTLVFTFSKPENFDYKPGQFAGFTLINPTETDSNGITRRFSLLSTPQDPVLKIVTRIQSSAFKRVLAQLPLESEIKFAGPSGSFVLDEVTNQPIVMLAGGIGIAPFMSMLHSLKKHTQRTIYLFYGNRTPADAPFLAELYELATKNAFFKFIPTIEQPSIEWQDEVGFISEEMIKKYVPLQKLPLFYICGAPKMVQTLHQLLLEMDIPEQNIHLEDFPGY